MNLSLTLSLRTDENPEYVIEKYSSLVYKLAFTQTKSKSDADDVFQEVFLQYIKSRKTFESEDHRKAWLIRVTVNSCKTLQKSAYRRHSIPLDENYVFEVKKENELYQVLKELPLKYRTVLHLFYYEDLQIEKISKILKISQNLVRMQLTRARGLLKEKLKGDFD